jgi:hypothetical protein
MTLVPLLRYLNSLAWYLRHAIIWFQSQNYCPTSLYSRQMKIGLLSYIWPIFPYPCPIHPENPLFIHSLWFACSVWKLNSSPAPNLSYLLASLSIQSLGHLKIPRMPSLGKSSLSLSTFYTHVPIFYGYISCSPFSYVSNEKYNSKVY